MDITAGVHSSALTTPVSGGLITSSSSASSVSGSCLEPLIGPLSKVNIAGSTPTTRPLFHPTGYPLKKNRAPLPPQMGVAAATASVIRQSSFLYGGVGAALTAATTQQPQ